METYPSEATRGELAVKLGLSDRQLQMWFCHRRQKDRKAVAPAGPSSVPMRDGVVKIEVTDVRNVSDFVSDLRPIGGMDLLGVVPLHEVMGFRRMGAALSEMDSSSSHEPHQTLHELQAIAFVESQLGESLRDDGPILGMEFDSVPLGAFGAPLGNLGFLIAKINSILVPISIIYIFSGLVAQKNSWSFFLSILIH